MAGKAKIYTRRPSFIFCSVVSFVTLEERKKKKMKFITIYLKNPSKEYKKSQKSQKSQKY